MSGGRVFILLSYTNDSHPKSYRIMWLSWEGPWGIVILELEHYLLVNPTSGMREH